MKLVEVFASFLGIAAIFLIVSTYSIFYKPRIAPLSKWRSTEPPFPGDGLGNLLWFVQVSDIHISRYYDAKRGPDFKDFCTNTLKTINPDVVLVTGDLTDAKSRNRYDSMQYEDEWETYQSIIRESNVVERFIWLDIRGNHDDFDVLRVDDPTSNLYLKYSGDKGKLSSNVYHLKKRFGKYSFIPVDATMIPGPRRPYNFAGYLSNNHMKKLEKFSEASRNSNYTIWYSHYPTASIAPDYGLRNLIGQKGGLYVAGHLHTLGGLTHSLYAMNPRGFMELELIDWLESRAFRIVAIDHDMFSFNDFKYNEWPAIILTNPKEAKYMMPHVEPIGRIKKSTHIRFLIFDPWKIEKVDILIDGNQLQHSPYQVGKSALWACRWDTSLYKSGMHDIVISVTDSHGNTKTVTQQFSLDTTWNLDFGFFASLVILTDFSTLLFYAFYIVSLGYACAIVFFRFYRFSDATYYKILPNLNKFLQDNFIFSGFLLFALNFMIGPWFAGELIRGTFGLCFPYGIWIQGVLQPDAPTLYKDGIEMTLTLHIPALIFLSYFNHAQSSKTKNNLQKMVESWTSSYLLFVYLFFIVFQFYAIWELYESYGLVSAILSPFKLWWTCFVLHITHRIYRQKPCNPQ